MNDHNLLNMSLKKMLTQSNTYRPGRDSNTCTIKTSSIMTSSLTTFFWTPTDMLRLDVFRPTILQQLVRYAGYMVQFGLGYLIMLG
ncbi:Protein of unknown function [Pyronema omphalodes CBS 100304]|uniref:Uncharacterized protein n=1 Tax=Pyronema omphalodes (strain CBS 100304) TaxID=1076935 RepID=U4LBX9_PYROM|nr:Protein of unknown function [Pyronema omphalodes CBS 100304]